jgi:hypothetical protein
MSDARTGEDGWVMRNNVRIKAALYIQYMPIKSLEMRFASSALSI